MFMGGSYEGVVVRFPIVQDNAEITRVFWLGNAIFFEIPGDSFLSFTDLGMYQFVNSTMMQAGCLPIPKIAPP